MEKLEGYSPRKTGPRAKGHNGSTIGPMGAKAGLYLALMVAVIVGMDLLFFRSHFWERLAANVGVVLIFVAFYFRFVKGT